MISMQENKKIIHNPVIIPGGLPMVLMLASILAMFVSPSVIDYFYVQEEDTQIDIKIVTPSHEFSGNISVDVDNELIFSKNYEINETYPQRCPPYPDSIIINYELTKDVFEISAKEDYNNTGFNHNYTLEKGKYFMIFINKETRNIEISQCKDNQTYMHDIE